MVSVMRLLWLLLPIVLTIDSMAEPRWLQCAGMPAILTALLVTSAAGTGLNILGMRRQAKTEAAMANLNAAKAAQEAKEAEMIAVEQQRQAAKRASLAYSEMRAGLAESGFGMRGTPTKMLADLEEELNRTTANVYRDAISRALNRQFESGIYRAQARAVRGMLPYQMGGTLLGGISDIGLKAYLLSNTGSGKGV